MFTKDPKTIHKLDKVTVKQEELALVAHRLEEVEEVIDQDKELQMVWKDLVAQTSTGLLILWEPKTDFSRQVHLSKILTALSTRKVSLEDQRLQVEYSH